MTLDGREFPVFLECLCGEIVRTQSWGQIMLGIELKVLCLRAIAGADSGTRDNLIEDGVSERTNILG